MMIPNDITSDDINELNQQLDKLGLSHISEDEVLLLQYSDLADENERCFFVNALYKIIEYRLSIDKCNNFSDMMLKAIVDFYGCEYKQIIRPDNSNFIIATVQDAKC